MAGRIVCCIVALMPSQPPRSPVVRFFRRGSTVAGATFAILALGALLCAPGAPAKAPLPTPVLRAVIRLNGDLQFGIEEAPAKLIPDLGSSNTACVEGLESEQGGGDPQPSWTALTELIQRGDMPTSRAIDGALVQSRAEIGDLRALLSASWRDHPAKLRRLTLATAEARSGIHLLRVALKGLGTAFEQWEQHDCTSAQESITATNLRIPKAVELINHGIEKTVTPLR
jgi:hypothetical protein